MFILFVSYVMCLSTLLGLISHVIKVCFGKWKSSDDIERVLLFFVLTVLSMALIIYQQTH